MDVPIEVVKVGKKFCRSLKRSMRYGLTDVTRDLFGISTRPETLRKDEFWAFRDASFHVQAGECLGVIGPNGAGKSTILKLVAGIYPPDQGRVTVRGRVGSLIEVGAGFHPLLSGRENVFINGAILGMRKREIAAKFDEIVAFSEIEDFIDSPVKHYSSGMFVRLGFAVAAHSNPDVLLVDEALAVGDLAFNIKCINRIAELRRQGTAVLFVSHNELQVRLAVSRCLLVYGGKLAEYDDIDKAYHAYDCILQPAAFKSDSEAEDQFNKGVFIKALTVKSCHDTTDVKTGDRARLQIRCEAEERLLGAELELRFWGGDGQLISTLKSSSYSKAIHVPQGESIISVDIGPIPLKPGKYRVAGGFNRSGEILCWSRSLGQLEVKPPDDRKIEAGVISMPAVFSEPRSLA